MAELLDAYEHEMDEIVVVPSRGGVFEVDLDGERVFSKEELGRHAEPGEVLRAIAERLR